MNKEKIKDTSLAQAVELLKMRFDAHNTRMPQRMHYKCQYYIFDEAAQRTRVYIGSLCGSKAEACLRDMVFISSDGYEELPEDDRTRIQNLAVRPLGDRLLNVRQRESEGGRGVFRFSSRNRQETIYYYRLDTDGKAIYAPQKLQTGSGVLLTDRCYLLTDEQRTFALYLQGSENELWNLPII